jgi:16S rRNA (cytosine967-C5)-methyltransferase
MNTLVRGPRYSAIEILFRWEENYQPLDHLMDQYFAAIELEDERDRQLTISMVYGVIRWRTYLDWVLGRFSSHPLSKMKNRTLQALRVGLFQLLFLDRIPGSAAVNETVQALKDMKQPKWLTGFVNGMLRNMERERHNVPRPSKNKNELPEAALLSHPEWLIARWQERYGKNQAAAICAANNTQAQLCLRVNTSLTTPSGLLKKLKAAGLNVEPGKFSPTAIRVAGFHGAVTAIPGFSEGMFQVQDEAAQLVTLLLGPLKAGNIYLDACAGLGGKTSHLAQMMPAGSILEASESHAGRVKKLRENLVRLRLEKTVTIIEGTFESLLSARKEIYHGVLLDVPCSGIGVIRRHPDIRWNRNPVDLLRYQEMQTDLLDAAADLVAPAGALVYATCSIEPEENEAVVKKFLEKHHCFKVCGCREVLPESSAALVDSRGFFRTLPGRDDLDGFFAAKLLKNDEL